MKYLVGVCWFSLLWAAVAQINPAIIFSHNDYLQKEPFYKAYELGAGYVEADVFARERKLLVAHTADEIQPERTLEKLYLNPIKEKITATKNTLRPITLMIDLKTEGISTLDLIVDNLKTYPELTACKNLTIAISGNVPDTAEWKKFPAYITFDGRPNKKYSKAHLKRVSFISNNFRMYSQWNGEGEIPMADQEKLKAVITAVHEQGKKIRFWGAPDVQNCWQHILNLEVDILGTDKIDEVAAFLKNH